MKMKEMVKNLIAKVKENKIKSGIITGLLVMTLVGGTATAMMSDNTAKADNSKTSTIAKTVKKDDVKKSSSKKVEKEIKENKESKPEEVKEAEKKLEEAKKSGNVEAIKEAEKLVETKKSAVKATAKSTASSNSTSKQTAPASKQTVSNSSNNSSKSSSEATKPAAPQKKKVWVETKPAWDEQVPDYNLPIYKEVYVCRFYNGAGQLIYTITNNSEDVSAKFEELTGTVKGLSLEVGYEDVPTGEYQTKTIHHEAEGEYVWQ